MLNVEMIETPSLGDRSYVVSDGEVAAVVDPQRDIDRILAVAERLGVRITHVVETHIHNDYVSGGLELSARTGAAYCCAADEHVDFDRVGVGDGDVVATGGIRLRVVATPGHTHHHVSYVLDDSAGRPVAVFSGGSMLHGATGRTDLAGAEHTHALARAQFRSVRRLAAELPDDAEIYPTHGFGSFCAATPTTPGDTTVGRQRTGNPALTRTEQEYVRILVAGLDAYPAYYVHMDPVNRKGPPAVDLDLPEAVDAATVRKRIDDGEWVVDLRARRAFAAGHVAGSLGFELGDSFATYLGWLYRYGTPLTLIGDSIDQVARARRELVRIGVDDLSGLAVGEAADLAPDGLRSYRVSDFAGLATAMLEGGAHVIDARQHGERAQGAVPGSSHIPLHELADRMDEVPGGEVWVYCASGYRASIVASLLDRAGHEVVLVDDSWPQAVRLGLDRR